MPTTCDHVNRGDLITADFMNCILDRLKAVEDRVTALDGSQPSTSGVVITSLSPSGPLRVGDVLEIRGRNFGFSSGAQRVFFNEARATTYRTGSSDTLLIVEIPPVPGVVETGTTVTLTVANLTTTDTRPITLRPAQQAQQGNVFLTFLGVNPTTPVAGSAFTANYRLESQALLPATVTLTPAVSVAAWQSLLQVLDAGGSVIGDRTLRLEPGQGAQFSVRLTSIPSGTPSGTAFSLTVNANSSGMTGSQDGPRSFTVGTASEQPDPSIELSFNVAEPPEAFNNDIIRVAPGGSATIQLRAEFSLAGRYDLSVSVSPATANWQAQLSQSLVYATGTPIDITAVPSTQFPAFDISPQAGAGASAQVVFSIQRQGETRRQFKSFTLQLGP